MVRMLNRLNAAKVAKVFKPGHLCDGGGLYLQVSLRIGGAELPAGKASLVSKSWTFRYRCRADGKLRELGLGPFPDVSLEEARLKAATMRGILRDGKDPKVEREAEKAAAKLEAAQLITFDQAAKSLISSKRAEWKNKKHADQWENTLNTYVSPIIGSESVGAIDLGMVLKVLEPIWTTKNETASRVRQRIEAVMAWATVKGCRTGENPARWKGHLDHLLPKPSLVHKVEHHPALEYMRMGEFMAQLRAQEGVGALALEFAILTAARSEEVLGAAAEEFDLKRALWTVPAERMKKKKEHVVPLSNRALEIVRHLRPRKGVLVFSGPDGEKMSDALMLAVIRRMDNRSLKSEGPGWRDLKGKRVVPHGFRSTFRDWAGECTSNPREVIENALAHLLKDKSEAAYARGTQLEKRKALMDSWMQYCAQLPKGKARKPRQNQ